MSVSELFQFVIMLTGVIALVYKVVKDHYNKKQVFYIKSKKHRPTPNFAVFLKHQSKLEKPLTVQYSL